jgi:hypothetical protein
MTQADLTLHFRECCSQHVGWTAAVSQIEKMARTGEAGTGSLLQNIQHCQILFSFF